MTDLPETYRIQHGCHDCAHVFGVASWRKSPGHFCNKTQDRPPYYDEGSFPKPMEYPKAVAAYFAAGERWDAWAATHKCAGHGMCDEWKESEPCA